MYKLKMTLKNKSHFQFCFEFALRTMEWFFEHWQHNPWGLQLVYTFYCISQSTRNQIYDNTGHIINVRKSLCLLPCFLNFFIAFFWFLWCHFIFWLQCMHITGLTLDCYRLFNQELVSRSFSSSSVNFFHLLQVLTSNCTRSEMCLKV